MPSISGSPVNPTNIPHICAPTNKNNILIITEFGVVYSGKIEYEIPHKIKNINRSVSGCDINRQFFKNSLQLKNGKFYCFSLIEFVLIEFRLHFWCIVVWGLIRFCIYCYMHLLHFFVVLTHI